MDQSERQSNEIRRERLIFSRLAKICSALGNVREEPELLKRIAEGVRAIGFDRVRLYLISDDRRHWIGACHIGVNDGFAGSQWSVKRKTDLAQLRLRVFKNNDNSKDLRISPLEEGIREWVWMPLLRAGSLIGGVSVDNEESGRQINGEALALLTSFAVQASAALENVRTLSEANIRADQLNALLHVSAKVNAHLDFDQILSATCQSAVELLGVGHSGFVRFTPSSEIGRVYAEFPDMGMVGHVVPLKEIPAWTEFIKSRRPFVSDDVANDSSLGPGRDTLIANNICSVMIVPVIGEREVLGSFSLDSVGSIRHFTDDELQLCEAFAQHVAVAIENAERFNEAKQEIEQLEKLRRTMLAIASPLNRDSLLHTIIQQSVGLLKAKSSGIYQYYPETEELTVVIDYNRQDQVGKTLKRGEGLAGQLVLTDKPFMIVDDYDSWSGKAKIYADKRVFGSVLAVPLKREGNVLGVLYIDDEVGRKFTPKDARLLGLFADQAAITFLDVIAEDEKRLERLKKLSSATEDILADLAGKTLDALLNLIAERATDVLDAEACGVFLVKQESFLSLEASFGHAEGQFKKGMTLPIRTGRKSGLTGHIAHEGTLFNACGRALARHSAVRGDGRYHSPSGKCYSLLAIPLKRKIGNEEKLIGLLRIDNKKGQRGRAAPTLAFTQEDEWILSIFAETVVVALESAEFVEQLGKQQENLKAFIDSSPNGIIAVDVRGNVTGFNSRAEEILGYKANEVLHTSVGRLYYEENESHKIGKRLKLRDGKLRNYDTFVRGKQGEKIAIRLSATSLNDDSGNRVGSVGYFDPSIREIQTLLLQANDIVASSDSLTGVLQKLAEKILTRLPHTFCRILLTDDSEGFLVVEAAHSVSPSKDKKSWTPRLKERIVPGDWPGLDRILARGRPRVIRWSNKRSKSNLERLSRSLNLKSHIQSLLLVPLRLEGRDVGLLEIGELLDERRSRFSEADIDLTVEVAAQITILIVMSLYRITNRHKEELERLHQAARAMASAFKLNEALQTIIEQAKETFDADSSALWSYDSAQDRFSPDDPVAIGIPSEEFRRFKEKKPEPDGTAYTVLSRGWIGIANISNPEWSFLGESTRSLLKRIDVSSFQGIALRVGNDPVGVLYLNYKRPRTFDEADRRALENFAAFAALSLKSAGLSTQLGTAKLMSEMVASMTALGDTNRTLRSVVEATQSAVHSDAIVLYTYDQAKEGLAYPPTSLGVRYGPKARTYSEVPTNSFVYKSLQQDQLKVVERVAEDRFFKRSRFARVEGIESCVVIPLKVAEQKVGLMFVNYRERHRFTDEERSSIQHFADQAAVAIFNSQLYAQAQKLATALEGLYQASQTIISSLSLRRTLNQVAQQALKILRVSEEKRCFSSVAFRTDNGLDVKAASPPRVVGALRRGLSQVDLGDKNSKHGIVGLAAITGEVQNVGDVRSQPDYIPSFRYIRSQLSVPLKVGAKVIGVLTVEHPDLNAFAKEDRRNIEMLAGQAAVAIQNAQQHDEITRKIKSLESLHQAAKAMAGVADFTGVLRVIVEKAKEMFGAHSCALWPYDDTQGRFLRDEPVAVGISLKEFERFREEEPKPGRTSYTVLTEGWVGLSDLSGSEAKFLGRQTVELLRGIRVKSFQGIALKVADESVGVLYLNYKTHRKFDEGERGHLENFARYAALSLLKARLAHQVKTAKSMSEVAANMTALGEPQSTLRSVTAGTQSAVECDAVVLFTYDRTTGKLVYPPKHVGVRDPDRAFSEGEVPLDALEYAMLRKKKPYIVEQTSKDKLFKGKSFAFHEHIESCVAIPLIASGKKVGLMFVNYRKHHRFDKDELISIKLFADQAAVAISNSQLHAEVENQARDLKKRTKALSGLYKAGQAITSSLSLSDTLERICQQALGVIDAGSDGRCFSHVALREGSEFSYAAATSGEILSRLQKTTSRVNLKPQDPHGKIKRRTGVLRRAVETRKVQNVPDVRADPDYNQISRIIRSQLSVPLKIGREVIGVLSVEHPKIAAFSDRDVQIIEALAAQAAVAIKNAQQFGELERTKGLVGSRTALAWMGMTSSAQGHAIVGHATNIQNTLDLLREELSAEDLTQHQTRLMERRLSTIGRQAKSILSKKIGAQYPWSQRVETFSINDFIDLWSKRLRENDFYPVGFNVAFKPARKDPQVRCSQDWLIEAFDILAVNAVEATEGLALRRLTMRAKVEAERVEIAFIDNGNGIPSNVLKNLFKERIRKRRTQGLGIGLLMAQAILQAYGGDIKAVSPGPGNTTMMIYLPEYRKRHRE